MSVDSLLENDAQMISGKGVAGCALLLVYPIGEMRLQLEFRSLFRRLRVRHRHRFPAGHLPADLHPDLPLGLLLDRGSLRFPRHFRRVRFRPRGAGR